MKPVLALVLALGLSGLSGCSRSFCGAPCEAPAAKRAAGPSERPTPLVNQYGSLYGHLEIDSLGAAQLKMERTSLELLLAQNERDAAILKVLKEGKLDTATFDYNDFSTGGSRFNASGKLRRDAGVKDSLRMLPRMISESQNRELIERYRHVRRRLSRLEQASAAALQAQAPEADTDAAPAPGDSLWSGHYRADKDTVSPAPGGFPELEGCEAWARAESEGFRKKAYAFEYECRKDSLRVRRKLW